jgi:hypothetical protein
MSSLGRSDSFGSWDGIEDPAEEHDFADNFTDNEAHGSSSFRSLDEDNTSESPNLVSNDGKSKGMDAP